MEARTQLLDADKTTDMQRALDFGGITPTPPNYFDYCGKYSGANGYVLCRWHEGSESSLSFGEPVLDWFDGKQAVRLDVTGYIFGRQGKGTFQSWLGRHVSGTFRAEDYSHHNAFLDKHLLNHKWKELYERECPKEGWWAAETSTSAWTSPLTAVRWRAR